MVILLFYWQNWSDRRFQHLSLKVSLYVIFLIGSLSIKPSASLKCTICYDFVWWTGLSVSAWSLPWNTCPYPSPWSFEPYRLRWALTETRKIAPVVYLFYFIISFAWMSSLVVVFKYPDTLRARLIFTARLHCHLQLLIYNMLTHAKRWQCYAQSLTFWYWKNSTAMSKDSWVYCVCSCVSCIIHSYISSNFHFILFRKCWSHDRFQPLECIFFIIAK